MTTFAQAVQAQTTTTDNGMVAFKSTLNACVDLFFKIGASRGKNIVPDFTAAYVEDPNTALRIAQWARDVRGGAGERQVFRDVLTDLEANRPGEVLKLLPNIPEIGRWDDLLIFSNPMLKNTAFGIIRAALENGNGLCAKWMPRKGKVAEELRAFLDFSPKRYRKTLVTLTQVVETPMCAKQWNEIDFSHVPSVAAARYKKAFNRNAPKEYGAYVAGLASGETKINAGAVYPYDVLKGAIGGRRMQYNAIENDVVLAQWAALENFVGDASILPMVDVSGSMLCPAGNNLSFTCMDVAVSLGLYLAEKNTGVFKDTFVTFTDQPTIYNLEGNVLEKAKQMVGRVGYSTNLELAIKEVLRVAKQGGVATEDMPEVLLILSDMNFDQCMKIDQTAFEMIKDSYSQAGYEMPKIVFWNLNAQSHAPVRFNQQGVALVSGFSPSIVKSILSAEAIDPMTIMTKAISDPRYDTV